MYFRTRITYNIIIILVAAIAQGQNLSAFPDLDISSLDKDTVRNLRQHNRQQKQYAWQLAREQGWIPRQVRNDKVYELMAIRDGRVYACQTCNDNSAISICVDKVRDTFPFDVSGFGQTVGIWDGGGVFSEHREFDSRVNIIDYSEIIRHATHVAGTIAAEGITSRATGMAPAARILSFDWTEVQSEAAELAMTIAGQTDKIQISNHSYSYIAGWSDDGSEVRWYGTWPDRESDYFGRYESLTRQWDSLCSSAPYYLPVISAGNDRSDNAPGEGEEFEYYDNYEWVTKIYDSQTDPYDDGWDQGGYDTIGVTQTAKNVLVIGAVNDAVNNSNRDLSRATMTSYSCWGPTDDGRIKPDLVTNGTSVYSCSNSGTDKYTTLSGTSVAAPAATGAAALILEYYNRFSQGVTIRSSTLKGLLIHTADDLGRPGPDYQFGWGLLNAEAALKIIKLQNSYPDLMLLHENSLATNNRSDNFTFDWDGSSRLKVTLCWTDRPGSIQYSLDDTSQRLVNDLDLRITSPDGSQIFLPFILDPSQPELPAQTGDNFRDNVEQVIIDTPETAGSYNIEVSTKAGFLQTQYYSLIVTNETFKPDPPQNVVAQPGPECAQVTVSWDTSTDATGYIIHYNRGQPGPPFSNTNDIGDANSITIDNFSAGATYFAVSAYNDFGQSDISTQVSADVGSGCSVIVVSGQIVTISGFGVNGITIETIPPVHSTTTDDQGFFQVQLPWGFSNGQLIPLADGWSFDPTTIHLNGPMTEDLTISDIIGNAIANYNGDTLINFEDFTVISGQWLNIDCQNNEWCNNADLDRSGYVDHLDLYLFATQWLNYPTLP